MIQLVFLLLFWSFTDFVYLETHPIVWTVKKAKQIKTKQLNKNMVTYSILTHVISSNASYDIKRK